uniref:Uncharacterized protein n=1 Tax=Anguilla anguilla TaxID=7936 RepID=A0A0E9RTH3_ANGAN
MKKYIYFLISSIIAYLALYVHSELTKCTLHYIYYNAITNLMIKYN